MCIRDSPAADLFQEVQAVVNTNLILADDTCGFAELGAGSNVDSVIITGQIIKIDTVSYTHLDVYKRQVYNVRIST